MSISDNLNDENILKILAADSEKLRKVGQLLSTPKSNKIYNICLDEELNAKEIAKRVDGTDNPRLPGFSTHLKNMVEVGILTYEKKIQSKNNHTLKFYKSVPIILIMPSKHFEKAQKSKTLRNTFSKIFKNGIKFASIGIIGISSFMGSQFIQLQNKVPYPPPNLYEELIIKIPYDIIWSIIITSIFVAGSILFLKLKKKKKLR